MLTVISRVPNATGHESEAEITEEARKVMEWGDEEKFQLTELGRRLAEHLSKRCDDGHCPERIFSGITDDDWYRTESGVSKVCDTLVSKPVPKSLVDGFAREMANIRRNKGWPSQRDDGTSALDDKDASR